MANRGLATVALPVLLAACGPEQARRPNVILVSIDTLRADHVGAYGYERDTTPFLDRLASESLLFERAFTPASWTLVAHASMLTGLQPDEHGVVRDGLAIAPGIPLLAERLSAAGYRTIGLYFAGWIHESRGFGRGFERFQNHANAEEAGRNLAAALDELAGERPFFLFLHLFDVHSQPLDFGGSEIYDAPEPYDELFLDESCAPLPALPAREIWEKGPSLSAAQLATLMARYDGAIRYVDAKLEQWFDELEQRGKLEDALVIVTSDHGESLGLRNKRLKGHGGNYQEALHVPLIVRLPRGARAGERVATPVQLGDIVPTVLDVCALAPDARLGGFSLRAPLPEQRILDGSRQEARYVLDWPRKFVEDHKGKVLFTDLEQDPSERSGREVDAAELWRLVELARGSRGPYPAPIPGGVITGEERDDLRALGYGGELDEKR